MTTLNYYPDKENRRAGRQFIFGKSLEKQVSITPGSNTIDSNLFQELSQVESFQDLVENDIIVIQELKPTFAKKSQVMGKDKLLETTTEDDENEDNETEE